MSAVYTFKWPKGPQEVILTGTFDNWSKSLFLVKQSDGSFELTVPLPLLDNQILYKYIVDGEWKTSPTEKVVADESGIENNYLSSEDLVVSKNTGSQIPESGGLFVAGGNSKKGDVNTTVLPSAEGKQATIAGEPGIQIPQDKDSLAAFTKFENPEDKGVKTAVLPSSEGQHATISGEPGIQVPQDKDSLAAFTKFENTENNETSELTPEERKKQKKKVKRTQYKAKKKKKAAEAAAFGAGGATAAGLTGASDIQEGSEATEGTEGNEITTTEGETEPEATPEPQTLDPNARATHTLDPQAKEQNETAKDNKAEEIIAAAGLSGVGAGVGAAATAGYALSGETTEGAAYDKSLDDKDTGAVALGGASTGKTSEIETSSSSKAAPESSSTNQYLPVTSAVEEPSVSQKQTEKDVTNEPSDESKHGKGALGASVLGGVALGGAALGGAGGAALASGSSAAHADDIKSDLPEYDGKASQLVDEKKLASEDVSAPSNVTTNKDSELPGYGGSDSHYPDEKKQGALGGAALGGGALGGAAIPGSSSKDQYDLPHGDVKNVSSTSQGNANDAYAVPESKVESSGVPYTAPQHEINNTSSEYPSEAETSKAEKYGAPALGGAAIAGGAAAIASSGHENDVNPQDVSGDVPLIKEENPTSTLDPKAHETAALNKEAEPSAVVSGDSNAAEKEVDASPVTRRDGAPPLTQYASADEIVIAQGATKKDNIEAELRAREHGDVIVEEIQPTESERQRLTEEAHLMASKDKSNDASNNKAAAGTGAAGVAGTSGATGASSKKAPVKKDAKKEEKKKKGFFSKLKSIFK